MADAFPKIVDVPIDGLELIRMRSAPFANPSCAFVLNQDAERVIASIMARLCSGLWSIHEADEALREFLRLNPGSVLLIKNIGV